MKHGHANGKNGHAPLKRRAHAGRPPKYDTAEALQAKIEEYFETGCNSRTVIVGPPTHRESVEIAMPTLHGLVLYLGYCDVRSFYDLEKQPKFSHAIKAARSRIAQVYEEQTHFGPQAGAIFALKNLTDWKDEPLVDNSKHYYFTGILQELRHARKSKAADPAATTRNRVAGVASESE